MAPAPLAAATTADLRGNALIAALPAEDMARWLPQLEWVHLPLGRVLVEPGEAPSHAYFPVTALVALLYVMESGDTSEIAVVGKNDVVVVLHAGPVVVIDRPSGPLLRHINLPYCQRKGWPRSHPSLPKPASPDRRDRRNSLERGRIQPL